MPDDPITEDERQKLRGIIGSLQYASVNTRPDLGSRLSHLQSRINCGQVKDLIESNKLLHDAKVHSQVAIRYQYIPLKDIRFVAFSDASFASEKNLSAHQGMMIMTAHQNIGKNHKSAVNPISMVIKKDPKGSSEYTLCGGHGTGRNGRPPRLVPFVLGMAARSFMPMEVR